MILLSEHTPCQQTIVAISVTSENQQYVHVNTEQLPLRQALSHKQPVKDGKRRYFWLAE